MSDCPCVRVSCVRVSVVSGSPCRNSWFLMNFHDFWWIFSWKMDPDGAGAVPRGTSRVRTVPHYPITRVPHHHGTTARTHPPPRYCTPGVPVNGSDLLTRLLLESTVKSWTQFIDSVAVFHRFFSDFPCFSVFSQRWFLAGFRENGENHENSRNLEKSSEIHEKVVEKVVFFWKRVLKIAPWRRGEIQM